MSVHDSNVVDVGTPPSRPISNWETNEVRFHGFTTLPISQVNYSPEFAADFNGAFQFVEELASRDV